MDWLVQKLDHVQDKYYEDEYHDRVVRSIVNIKTRINLTKFDLAVKKMIDMVPILNTVLVDHGHTVTWHSRQTYDEIVTVVRSNPMFLSHFLKPMDESKKPQIRITIWGTTIGFSVNNMILDIYALRDLVCLFIDLYKNIDIPAYVSKYSNFQSRNIYKFFKTIPYAEKHFFGSLKKLSTAGHNKYTLPIPTQPTDVTNRWLITETVPPAEIAILKEYAKNNDTTLEDVMLGAYHKALAASMEVDNLDFCIGRFFNARTHSKTKPYISWNNLHAVLPYSFKTFQEQDFALTIKDVDAISDFIAKKHLVIKACIKDSTKKHLHDDYFIFSYVRVTDDITFNTQEPEIFFSLAARNVPYAALTFTESNETVRICAVNYIDEEGIKVVDYITKMIHYYLQLLIYQIQNGIEINFAPNTHVIQDALAPEQIDDQPVQTTPSTHPIAKETTSPAHKAAKIKTVPVKKESAKKSEPEVTTPVHKMPKVAKTHTKKTEKTKPAKKITHKPAKAVKAKPAVKKAVKSKPAKKPVHKSVKVAKTHTKKIIKSKPTKKITHKPAKAVKAKPAVKKAVKTHTKKTVKAKPVAQHQDNANTALAHWTPAQHQLVVAFKKYHGEQLIPVEGDTTKVRYLIKGKNTYQKRSWAEIKKFVEYKTGSNK